MKIQQFLEHHRIAENPFGQEDAQSDQVFKQRCIEGTYHPAWDKVYGTPRDPSTAVVFGEKGSGKTALRLQIIDHLRHHNAAQPDARVYVVEYDDFNPFLDTFKARQSSWQTPENMLKKWRLWDHMDALLTIGVTRLVSQVLGEQADDPGFRITPEQVGRLSAVERRDLLLLAAFYDRSPARAMSQRWSALRKVLKFPMWRSQLDLAGAVAATLGVLIVWGLVKFESSAARFGVFLQWWFWLILAVAWGPWLWRQARLWWTGWTVGDQIHVVDHPANMIRQVLSQFRGVDLLSQPIPNRERSDDRYELLAKYQGILRTLGFTGILVIVDRVDEPHFINGNVERMKRFVWPLFDNKFLKQSGIGIKLLLPIEVSYHLNREDKEFYERSRLDKQNLVPSLEWTGESLFDVANARIRACADPNQPGPAPTLKAWFDNTMTDAELIAVLARLRVPRHLFKFLYRLLTNHCNKFSEANPRWTIDRETLHASMAVYQRELDAFDRGLGTG